MDRELEAAPERQILRVAEGLHLGRVLGARVEREQAGAAAGAERAVERQRSGLAVELELDGRRAEPLVAGREAAEFIHRERLAHVPVAVPGVRAVGRAGADLKKHLAVLQLSGPRAGDVTQVLNAGAPENGHDGADEQQRDVLD